MKKEMQGYPRILVCEEHYITVDKETGKETKKLVAVEYARPVSGTDIKKNAFIKNSIYSVGSSMFLAVFILLLLLLAKC